MHGTIGRARIALAGALLVVLAAAALGGRLDGWTVVGALLALLVGLAVIGRQRPSSVESAPRSGTPASGPDAVLALLPDPVILVDRRAVVTAANPAAHALLPTLRQGHPLSFALRAPDVLAGIRRAARTGDPERVAYAERVPTERSYEVRIGAFPADRVEGGLLLHFRDLTASQRLESMRVDFVANASHELRTPLASLLGFIETLQGPARSDPAARERFLSIMREQARRMARLVDDLLSLSRIELKEHVPPRDRVPVLPVLRQVIDAHGPLAAENGVAIALTAADGPDTVLGDRDELVRVVENLVENAVKYGGSGGRVDVALGPALGTPAEPGIVEVRVSDHGPGIASEHLPRLTERFYRVSAAASREKGGTGLGLAIVKHILNRHGGRLAIESEPGRGATFRVLIPAAS